MGDLGAFRVGCLLPVPATFRPLLLVEAVFVHFLPYFCLALGTIYSNWLIKKIKLEESKNNLPFRPAKVVDGATLYIEFWAWNDIREELQRRRIFSFAGNTKAEKIKDAEKQAKEITKLLDKGFKIATGKHQKPAYLLDAFKAACRIREIGSTYQMSKQNRGILLRFIEFTTARKLDRMELEKFSRGNVYDFLDWAKEERNISNRTRNNYRDMLASVFEVMFEREWIKANPAVKVKRLREKSSQYVPFTDEQRAVLEKYLIDHNKPLFYFTRLIYYGFIRPVEICRLKISDIFLDRGVILVYTHSSKNKKQQPVVITKSLDKYLREYLGKHPDAPERFHLFGKGFKPGPEEMHRNKFSVAHREALEACELYNGILKGYAWKHTGVINAHLAGVDIKTIQHQCRHYSLDETEKYMKDLGLRLSKSLKN